MKVIISMNIWDNYGMAVLTNCTAYTIRSIKTNDNDNLNRSRLKLTAVKGGIQLVHHTIDHTPG